MNYNAKQLFPFYKNLNDKVKNKKFYKDKTGVNVVEELAVKVELDANDEYIDFNKRKTPRKYAGTELNWYLSQELHIGKVSDVTIWKKVSDLTNQVNSNYGYLVFSKGNYSQFQHVIETLKEHKDSRQAIIIYTRPSIHLEWDDLEGSDFICTLYQQFFIRNMKLHCITNQRSVDAIFGLFNDIPWFHYVIKCVYEEMKKYIIPLELGDHIYIANSFHVYERHFDLLKELVNSEE